MSEFLGLLGDFKANDKDFVVTINCKKMRVKVADITGDLVTLHDQDSTDRFDMHYTSIVICSKRGQ